MALFSPPSVKVHPTASINRNAIWERSKKLLIELRVSEWVGGEKKEKRGDAGKSERGSDGRRHSWRIDRIPNLISGRDKFKPPWCKAVISIDFYFIIHSTKLHAFSPWTSTSNIYIDIKQWLLISELIRKNFQNLYFFIYFVFRNSLSKLTVWMLLKENVPYQ